MSQPSRENPGPMDRNFQTAMRKSVLVPKVLVDSDC